MPFAVRAAISIASSQNICQKDAFLEPDKIKLQGGVSRLEKEPQVTILGM